MMACFATAWRPEFNALGPLTGHLWYSSTGHGHSYLGVLTDGVSLNTGWIFGVVRISWARHGTAGSFQGQRQAIATLTRPTIVVTD